MKQRNKKQVWLLAALACLLIGCAGRPAPQEPKKEEISKENQSEAQEDSGIINAEVITPQTSIKKIENGLSIVQFQGNDGFSTFLENGGASSDAGVLEYLTENMLSGAGSFMMRGNPFGCSAISAVNENGEFLFGRNFDWYHCDALIVVSHPENAYASISTVNTNFIKQGAGIGAALLNSDSIMTTAALYAPLDGMNEQGFCVSVNMIEDSDTIEQNTGKTGITTTTAVRLLLNNAADVEDAVQLLETYDLHASFGYMVHFALSDAKGNHVVVEYVDNEMVVTQTPVVTNFYLSDGKKYGIGTSQSHDRYDILMEKLTEQETLSEQDVRDALESVSKHNYDDGETTEWSIIFNQTTKEAVYFHREDYEKAYRISL